LASGAAPTTDKYPVTIIGWRDAIVRCNALSEMAGFTSVYKYNGTLVQDSSNATACDGVSTPTDSDKDFRLPTSMERELAARYRGSDNTNAVLKMGFIGRKATRQWGDCQLYRCNRH
jgi:hypothetical protein